MRRRRGTTSKKYNKTNKEQKEQEKQEEQEEHKEQEKYEEHENHAKQYSELLKVFVNHINLSNNSKNKLKTSFFRSIIGIMIFLTVVFTLSIVAAFFIISNIKTADSNSIESIVGAIVSIIPSLATMLVALFKLPEIIASYLFNREEDTSMVSVIEKIQNYDVQMYSMKNDIEKVLMKSLNNSDTSSDLSATKEEHKKPETEETPNAG